MQAYSLDLRERVVAAYENGAETISQVASRFAVSAGFVKKMLFQRRATGSLVPVGHRGGQPKRLSDNHRRWLLKTVLAQADVTLADLQASLAKEKRVSVSVPTLWRELRALNLRRKKNRWSLVKETVANEPGIGAE